MSQKGYVTLWLSYQLPQVLSENSLATGVKKKSRHSSLSFQFHSHALRFLAENLMWPLLPLCSHSQGTMTVDSLSTTPSFLPIPIPLWQLPIPRNKFFPECPVVSPGRDSEALPTRKLTPTTVSSERTEKPQDKTKPTLRITITPSPEAYKLA